MSLFNLHEMFLAFICANNIRSLVNYLFGVKSFNSFPSFTSSSPSSGGISDKSTDSSLSLFLVVSADSSFLNQSSELYVSTNKLMGSYLLPNFYFLFSERAMY